MRFYFFVGTTTELIKLAPIIRRLEKRKIDFKIITSGQTDVKFEELSFLIRKRKADIKLGKKESRSSVLFFLIWSISTFFKAFVLKKEFEGLDRKSTYFVVHGDPVSSLIGAIIAKIYRLNLVHIESGLRSFNFLEPFPEEISRVIISRLADYHFCPNEWSYGNLKNIGGKKINTKQNTLIESTWFALRRKSRILEEIGVKNKKYFVLIVHRQEHVIFGKEESKEIINFILKNANKNLLCVFVRHSTTENFLKSVSFKVSRDIESRVKFVSRLHYVDFVRLLKNSEFIATDGGSNQEETYYMGVPCLILRNHTERVEGLGENAVIAKGNKVIIKKFLNNYHVFKKKEIHQGKDPSRIIVDTFEDKK